MLYIILSYKIHRTNKFHTLKICTVEFWHHCLHLSAVQHTHKYGFNNIIIVVTECDFITAEFFCFIIEVTPSHSGAKIARRFFYMHNRLKYIRLKNSYRNIKHSCVILYFLPVSLVISRVHHKINHFKRKLVMPFQLLKQFSHKHRVLTARNAHGDFVARLNHIIFVNSCGKSAPYCLMEFFIYTAFNILCSLIFVHSTVLKCFFTI